MKKFKLYHYRRYWNQEQRWYLPRDQYRHWQSALYPSYHHHSASCFRFVRHNLNRLHRNLTNFLKILFDFHSSIDRLNSEKIVILNCHSKLSFWGKTTRMITRANFSFLTNSPHLWFWKFKNLPLKMTIKTWKW